MALGIIGILLYMVIKWGLPHLKCDIPAVTFVTSNCMPGWFACCDRGCRSPAHMFDRNWSGVHTHAYAHTCTHSAVHASPSAAHRPIVDRLTRMGSCACKCAVQVHLVRARQPHANGVGSFDIIPEHDWAFADLLCLRVQGGLLRILRDRSVYGCDLYGHGLYSYDL